MKLQVASRNQARIRLAIQGSSGSGKSLGALQVAYGLCADWTKIAVIDTEHGSASLYSHLGAYNVLGLSTFNPEAFISALEICENSNMDVIIIDSISSEWAGTGGILDIHNSMTGNSFSNWSKVIPRHDSFIQRVLASRCHVLVTLRSKQDYVLTVNTQGKTIPENVGLKPVTREGLDYEMTTVFEVDIKHNVIATKDRTSLFAGKPEFRLTPIVGEKLRDWCNQGTVVNQRDILIKRIEDASTVEGLLKLYKDSPAFQSTLHEHFSRKRKLLETTQTFPELLRQQNQSNNGQHDASEG